MFRLVLVALILIALAIVVGPMLYMRTPYNTSQFAPMHQPVEFDHRHHVSDNGIPCLYCHRDAEVSSSAGIPPTSLCMGCHAQIWNQSPKLDPVRQSYFSGQPIPWRRVHSVPDFTMFHHAVHVRRGIDCAVCHGAVEQMAQVYRVAPLSMGWCLDCHRNPERYLAEARLPGSMISATFQNFFPAELGQREVDRLTTCTACHR